MNNMELSQRIRLEVHGQVAGSENEKTQRDLRCLLNICTGLSFPFSHSNPYFILCLSLTRSGGWDEPTASIS